MSNSEQQLQDYYPVNRKGERMYINWEFLTPEEIEWNASRMEATGKIDLIEHAQRLRAHVDPKGHGTG